MQRTRGSSTLRQSPLSLNFLVVGAGLTGLATAVALRKAGHRVTLLDGGKEEDVEWTSALRIPPNFTRILANWDLEEQLALVANRCRELTLRDIDSNDLLGKAVFWDELLEEAGSDFVTVHYDDMRRILLNAAVALGALVQFNSQVISVDPHTPSVTLASSQTLSADVLVGADGARSIVRASYPPQAESSKPGMTVYGALVPISQMPPEMSETSDFRAWMGAEIGVIGIPIPSRSQYALQVLTSSANTSSTSWTNNVPQPPSHVIDACAMHDLSILRTAKFISYAEQGRQAHVDEWVHPSGRTIVIGDAAHPMPPGGVFTGALGVEDAAVLGAIFARVRTADASEITTYLSAISELRSERCAHLSNSEWTIYANMRLPPGPTRDEQRTKLSESLGPLAVPTADGAVDVFAAGFGLKEPYEYSELFGYDPLERAEEWWARWGSLRARSQSASSAMGGPHAQTTAAAFLEPPLKVQLTVEGSKM